MPLLPGAGLEARERRILVWGSAALFLAGWADVSVKNVSETLFLKRIGVDYLPLAFLANSLMLMGTTSVLGALARYVDPLRLFTRALAGLGLLLFVLWAFVHTGGDASYPVLVIAAKQISAISLISFAVAIGALLDPRQARTALPPLLAGGTLGTILGSFASAPLGRWLDVQGLLPVAGGLLLLGAGATLPLRGLPAAKLMLERRGAAALRQAKAGSKQAGRHGPTARQLWRESWLFRALALSALVCGAVGPMLYFQFSYVADMATRGSGGEEKLLSLYAVIRGWLQTGVLVVQLWLAPALFRRIGIALAGTFSPLLYLLGFGGLTFRLGLPEGVAALSGATVQDQAVHDPAQRIMAVLFAEDARARVAAFTEGTAKRLGALLGNLLVLTVLALGNVTWVGVVGVPLTLVWLGITLRIWRGYPGLILSLATEPWRLSRPGFHAREIVDTNTLRSLASAFVGEDLERCRAAIEVLRELRPDAGPSLLGDAIPNANSTLRPLLVEGLETLLEDVTVKPGEHRARVRKLGWLLQQQPPEASRERAAIVRIYARLQDPTEPAAGAAELLHRATHDPAPVVRVAAETALYRLGLREGSPLALRRVLGPALESEDPVVRDIACRELRALLIEDPQGEPTQVGAGRPEWHARLGLLVAALFRPAARADAAAAIASVAARRGRVLSAAGPEMLALADDPDPRVRAAALRFIGHTRRTENASILAQRLAATHPEEAAAAAEALRALGPAALEFLLPEFSFGRRSVRDAIVPLLRELEVEKEAFQAQLRRELEGVAERLLELAALRGRTVPLLLRRIEERAQSGLHTAFLLLGALHDDDRIVALGDSLMAKQSPRHRALRVEALEALLNPDEREQLIPFVEDPRLDTRTRAAIRLLGRRPLSRDATLEAMLDDPDPLTRTLLEWIRSEKRPAAPLDGDAVAEAPMLSEVEVLLRLRNFRLFEALTVRELADVARLVTQEQFEPGAVIVREGEYENSMYAITEGKVRVTRRGAHLADLETGQIFGELAVFDGESRSASVTALETTRVLRIEARDLLALMEELPGIAIAICRTLSRLVRELTKRATGEARKFEA